VRRELLQDRLPPGESFDMTPIIDVVFLLIIFFILVFQFISAESYEVAVPDRIVSARPPEGSMEGVATVTVMKDERGGVVLAVGSEKLSFEGPDAAGRIAQAIDARLDARRAEHPRVCLRCEKDIPFQYTKVVLDAVSRSSAEQVQWAVLGRN
jgi:biopolymer transport protein ExbD